MAKTKPLVCFNCICKAYYKITSYVGANHVKGICHHGKKYSVHFERTKFSMVIAVVLMISIGIIILHNIFELINHEVKLRTEVIFKLGLITFQVTVFITLFTTLYSSKLAVLERKGFAAIVFSKDRFGVKYFLNNNNVKDLNIYMITAIVSTIIVITTVTICELVFAKNYEFWTIYNALVSCGYMLIETLSCSILIIKIKLYTELIKQCYEQIKLILNERLNCILKQKNKIYLKHFDENNVFITESVSRMDFPIDNMLKKLQRMHCAIIRNVEVLIISLNPYIILHLIAHILIFILNYYLIIVIWSTKSSVHLLPLKQLETNSILIGTIWLFYENEKFFKPEEDILTFLENFPIQKLKPKEICQIDILKLTIRRLRPTTVASGIINVRINILGSIAATVMSYVLLALQFRASW